MTSNYRKKLGNWGEGVAQVFLQKKGYQVIERHWQKQPGEIDIIAYEEKAHCLVFIEVKTRTSEAFGPAEASIDDLKRSKLEKVIGLYLAEMDYQGDYRFDLIIIFKGRGLSVRHYQNLIFD